MKRLIALVLALTFILCGAIAAAAEEMPEVSDEVAEDVVIPEPPEIQEDFYGLLEENPDTIGWLKIYDICDTAVVHLDNEFYLDHNFYGKPDNNGTLFLNGDNILWPRDKVLFIHGHNMKSGAMFGNLMYYEAFTYLQEHPLISFRTIYDPEEVMYVPFAGFNASMEPTADGYFDLLKFYFETEEEHQAYLDEVLSLSAWKSPADVTLEDDILVLVTCSYYHTNGRYMLFLRPMRQDETEEGIIELFKNAEQ